MDREEFPAALRAQGAGRHPQSRSHRRRLLDAAFAAAHRVDPRARPAAVDGEDGLRGHWMSKTVEFFYDFTSPTAYLAWTQLPKIAARTNAKLVYRPMFLGGVMQATENRPPGTVPAKGKWMAQDLARWAKRY